MARGKWESDGLISKDRRWTAAYEIVGFAIAS